MAISISVNGEQHSTAEGQTILELLGQMQIDPARVAVELDRRRRRGRSDGGDRRRRLRRGRQFKAASTEAALFVSNKLIELAGSRATLQEFGLDRHWRNARTHSVHDPVRWKYRAIGDYWLNGVNPPRHGAYPERWRDIHFHRHPHAQATGMNIQQILAKLKAYPLALSLFGAAILLAGWAYYRSTGALQDATAALDQATQDSDRFNNNVTAGEKIDEQLAELTADAKKFKDALINPTTTVLNEQYFYDIGAQASVEIVDPQQGLIDRDKDPTRPSVTTFELTATGHWDNLASRSFTTCRRARTCCALAACGWSRRPNRTAPARMSTGWNSSSIVEMLGQ